MKKILKISSAFIGVIVGAGFASGQEILQYFTSFGTLGIFGAIVSTLLFGYFGMILVWAGSKTNADDHKIVIKKITDYPGIGRVLSWIIDIVLIHTLFSFGVVMLAGAGSNLEQQFGIPFVYGTALMALIVISAGMLKIDFIVKVIGYITPFLVIMILIISIYCIVSLDTPYSTLDKVATSVDSPFPHWIIAGINYVSMNIGLGAAMAIVIGGAEINRKAAAIGGLVGGLVLGVLIILSHLAIFSKIEVVKDLPLPMLGIVNEISPTLGIVMSIIIFAMIFNTALSMFYSFTARFTMVGTRNFKIFYIVSTLAGFGLSFVGFTKLVNKVYPILGNLNYLLILIILLAPLKLQMNKKTRNS
ncbi:YkvI family membrane protein [Macrococcus animalis]|uniref:YkvI family membrane protein n=1 Tax=Macrococcus animalis TaxID=3395467 RepID=UPI0039BE0296